MKKRGFIGLFELPRTETVLVFGHVDALAAEPYAFHFKPRALFEAGFVLEFDFAAGAHHALPGQGIALRAQQLRHVTKRELIVECRKHAATKWLQSVPFLRPVRAAVLIGRVQTPHRFRTKRQFWAYCGLALETRDSGEYRMVNGQVARRKKPVLIRGLNWNHNHAMKGVFKGAATSASICDGVFREFYLGLLNKGMLPEMARLTLARKIAAITLKIWKKGEAFDSEKMKIQAA